mgnify:CR=1 FL=1
MDQIIYHRIMSILMEIGLFSPISPLDEFDADYCCQNIGPFRLYEFAILMRDDVDEIDLITNFCDALHRQNEISTVKVEFYDIKDYPAPMKNFSMMYLTVTTV